ncbi:MAG: cyclic nucleotide-binding domain-containing protein [Candidatus Sericytochromatia bacterium]
MIKKYLSESKIFQEFDKKELKFLEENAALLSFEKDEFIFFEHDKADNFYILLDGEASLKILSQERGLITIENIRKNEIIGWSWLNEPFIWKFSCMIDKPSTILAFNADAIRKEMETNAKFGYKVQKIFIKIMAERLYATRMRLYKEMGDNIYIREY